MAFQRAAEILSRNERSHLKMDTCEFDDMADAVRQPLTAFAIKLSRDSNLADDLVQETLLIAHRKFAKFDPQRGAFKSWCNSILLNKYRDYLRSAKRREIPVTSLTPTGDGLDEIADPAAMRDLVQDAEELAIANVSLSDMLTKLSATERRIALMLSRGEAEEEIMAALRVSPAKLEHHIMVMRIKLREYERVASRYSMRA